MDEPAWKGVLRSGLRWAAGGALLGGVGTLVEFAGLGTPTVGEILRNAAIAGSLLAGPGLLYGVLRRLPLPGLEQASGGWDALQRAVLGALSTGLIFLTRLLDGSGLDALTRSTSWMALLVFAVIGAFFGWASPSRAALDGESGEPPRDAEEPASLPRTSVESILGDEAVHSGPRKKTEAPDVP